MDQEQCQHKYIYAGIKFKLTNLSHSNSQKRTYYDFFFCEKCAKQILKELAGGDNTYSDVQYNATPIQD